MSEDARAAINELRVADSDAAYQQWLRRRLAKLREQQRQRILLADKQKADLDAAIARAQREIDNLAAQQTIGVVE